MNYNEISKGKKLRQPTQEKEVIKKTAVVIVNKLYLRCEPDGEQLKILKFGTKLSIINQQEMWLEVKTAEGEYGFVMRSFVKEVM